MLELIVATAVRSLRAIKEVSEFDLLLHHDGAAFNMRILKRHALWQPLLQARVHVFFDVIAARNVQLVEELLHVRLIVESIREDAAALMHPEPHHFTFLPMLKGFHHLYAANDSRDVSQIEQVVGLSRCRSQVLIGESEHINGCVDNLLERASRVCAHDTLTSHMRLYYLAKDALHHQFVEIAARDDVKMASEPWRDWILTAGGWAHSTDENDVCDLLQLVALVIVIVPLLVIHPLTKQLDRWLSTLFLNCRHIHIIDKDNELLVIGWA